MARTETCFDNKRVEKNTKRRKGACALWRSLAPIEKIAVGAIVGRKSSFTALKGGGRVERTVPSRGGCPFSGVGGVGAARLLWGWGGGGRPSNLSTGREKGPSVEKKRLNRSRLG